jgi:hypothetical protein
MSKRRAYLIALMIVLVFELLMVLACHATPRAKPLPTTPIESGEGTVQATRRALEGHWTLIAFDITAEDGRQAKHVDATGMLAADAYGNLTIEYRLSEAGQRALEKIGVTSPNPVISTTGRVAIDIQRHSITYVAPDAASRAFEPGLAAKRANPFALERTRYYAFDENGLLTLVTRHDSGREAAKSQWRKLP